MWQKRRTRFLLNLIDHLPRTSHFTAAVAQDDELAEAMGDEIRAASDRKPPVTEFGSVEEILAEIYDLLQVLNANTVTAAGGKPAKPKPYRRPETAAQRLKRRQEYVDFLDIVAQVAPHDLARLNAPEVEHPD